MMRRHRRGILSGLFYNTGDLEERSVSESTAISRDYANSIQEPMLEEERIRRKKEEEERNRQNPNTSTTPPQGPQ